MLGCREQRGEGRRAPFRTSEIDAYVFSGRRTAVESPLAEQVLTWVVVLVDGQGGRRVLTDEALGSVQTHDSNLVAQGEH